MTVVKRKPIAQLGVELKNTKDEKILKELYERLHKSVIDQYKGLASDTQLLEDAYTEAITTVWQTIDKLDVETYSISTVIYLKTKQRILRQNKLKGRTTGNMNLFFTSDSDNNHVDQVSNLRSFDSMIYDKYKRNDDFFSDKIDEGPESTLMKGEGEKVFWNVLSPCKYLDLIYDYYCLDVKYKDLAEKYDLSIQTVKNRIRAGKKQIYEILNGRNEEIIKLLN